PLVRCASRLPSSENVGGIVLPAETPLVYSKCRDGRRHRFRIRAEVKTITGDDRGRIVDATDAADPGLDGGARDRCGYERGNIVGKRQLHWPRIAHVHVVEAACSSCATHISQRDA